MCMYQLADNGLYNLKLKHVLVAVTVVHTHRLVGFNARKEQLKTCTILLYYDIVLQHTAVGSRLGSVVCYYPCCFQ